MNISVIGLGKLGAVLAGVMADKGHEVVGADVNPAAVAAINQGVSPVREPGLDEMIRRNAARMSATADFAEAVAHTDVTFVVVPTPSGSGWNIFFAICFECGGADRSGVCATNPAITWW